MNVLFLCTGNSCRSQIAEAFANNVQSNLKAYSAGTDPKGINPYAVKVMNEIGIDISENKSQHVDDFLDIKFDFVITLCGSAKETCPFFQASTKNIHNGFDDPPELAENMEDQEEILNIYRRVRDEIKDYVLQLPKQLLTI